MQFIQNSARVLGASLAALAIVAFLSLNAGAQETGKMYDEAKLLETGELADMAIGEPDASVTIIEYASMTCPHCAAFHKDVYPKVKENYIDTGKARMVFREFPLDRLAAAASMVARCVEEDRFFPFVSVLFSQQKTWVQENPLEPLKKLAKQAGLSDEAFDKCVANQELLDAIVWVRDRGEKEFDITGTPTFFVGGEIVRAEVAQDFDKLSKIIDRHLGE